MKLIVFNLLQSDGSATDNPQEGPNKFMLLCDSVHSSLALVNNALEEVITAHKHHRS